VISVLRDISASRFLTLFRFCSTLGTSGSLPSSSRSSSARLQSPMRRRLASSNPLDVLATDASVLQPEIKS